MLCTAQDDTDSIRSGVTSSTVDLESENDLRENTVQNVTGT